MRTSLGRQFAHDAMFFDCVEDLIDPLVPFLRNGINRGEAAAVATTRHHIGLLRDALGDLSDEVRFFDSEQWYVQPARTIAAWSAVLADAKAHGHPYLRIVGEVRFGTAAESPKWTRYESAVNRVFADSASWIVCPYDMRLLPASVVADAVRTHPAVWDPRRRESERYVDPAVLLAEIPEPMPAVIGPPRRAAAIGDNLAAVRAIVRDTVGTALPEHRVSDLLLALTEVASNGLRHGIGARRMAVWVEPGRVVCDVSDEGTGPADPLVGYLPPPTGATDGMGLWLARHVCDAFAIRTSRAGTTVRFAITT